MAKTPHYDGVKKAATESAIIAISGIGPITYSPDRSKEARLAAGLIVRHSRIFARLERNEG
jgi:hypothetical protein